MNDDEQTGKKREEAALVPLLLVMTVVTGAVDAVSILRLGHVFVANMTGNVVFLGFALAGSSEFSVSASLVALAAFLGGAAVAGRTLKATARTKALRRTATVEASLVTMAALVALATTGTTGRYAMTVLLALAMGAQNAIVRGLAVPDLTTTVLTLTLTGLAADRHPDQGRSPTRRRIGAVAAMLGGAAGGGVLVLHVSTAAALAAAAILLAAVAAATYRGNRGR